MRCAVVGGGAWGTALSDLLASAGHDVIVWAREPDVVEQINASHANPRFLVGATLDPRLRATGDLSCAVDGAELVVHSAPSHALREVLRSAALHIVRVEMQAIEMKNIDAVSRELRRDVITA